MAIEIIGLHNNPPHAVAYKNTHLNYTHESAGQ